MLKLTYELSHKLIPQEKASRLYVLLKIAAPLVDMKTRRALNLGLVIDRSGSMQGEKINYCIHAAKFLVSQLAREDIFSLVTFADEAFVNIQAAPVLNKELHKSIIDKIGAQGSTNLSGGWLASSAQVFNHFSPDRLNRIILLTDGQANAGIKEHDRLVQIAADLEAKGVSTTAIGFGKDFAEDLLHKIAEHGRGNYYFIDSPEKAPRTFSEELSELLTLFAQNLTLTITPSEQVEFVGIHHDFRAVRESGSIKITLGDIFSGDERSILMEFVTPASKAAAEAGISVVGLSYQQVHEEITFKEISAFIKVGYGQQEEVERQVINPIVEREITICKAIQARKDAIREADAGDLAKARESLQKSIENIETSSFSQDEALQEETKKLKGLLINFDSREQYKSIGRKEAYYGSVVMSGLKGIFSSKRSGLIPWHLIEALKNASHVTVITGSAMAIECGIPGVRGLTATVGDEDVKIFTAQTFDAHPDIIWETIRETQEKVVTSSLKESYRILAEMEDFWMYFQLITENVDGLHRIAGNKKVMELYGSIFRSRCPAENKVIDLGLKAGPRLTPDKVCSCGSPLRPDVLWLGEAFEEAQDLRLAEIFEKSKIIILLGTTFHRSRELLEEAKKRGTVIMEVHPAALAFSDIAEVSLQKSIEYTLPVLWKEIKG